MSRFRRIFVNSKGRSMQIVAEIKLASPSAGILGRGENITSRAKEYELGGADAISVVVDKKFFHGDYEFIRLVKKVSSLPILAKDFVIDPYQIYEAKIAGASAVLLIVKILSQSKLSKFVRIAQEIGIEPIVEVGNRKELERALFTDTVCIAVNARNLSDFLIDIDAACNLIKKIPSDRISVGFSGIKSPKDVKKYKKAGAKAILVGTSLMRTKNIKKFIRNILNHSRPRG